MDTLVANKIYFGLQFLRGEPVARALADLEKTEFASFDELLAIQAQRQLDQLRFAIKFVPFYQEFYTNFLGRIERAEDVKEVNDLMSQLPILDKNTVQENQSLLTACNIANIRTYLDKTSGSSGSPLIFPCDQTAWAYRHAMVFRCLKSFGIQVGEPYIYIFGLHWHKTTRIKLWLRDWVFNRKRISAFEIGPRSLDTHVKKILAHKPTHMIGYPSAIYELCVLLRERSIDALQKLRLKGIFLTAEPLRPYQRELIEEVTESRCINGYGSAEGGVNALECPYGSLHIQMEGVQVQLGDPDTVSGEAIVTDMMLRAFPIIRYAIGDVIVFKPGHCSCGRQHLLIDSIEGRSGEPIILPNGRRINANLPSYIFKPLTKYNIIRRYRFVHTSDNSLKLYLVVTKDFKSEHLERIDQEIKLAFGDDISVPILLVDKLPILPNAKHRDYLFVNDPPDMLEA